VNALSREAQASLSLPGRSHETIALFSEAVTLGELLQGEARRDLPALYAYLGLAQWEIDEISPAERSFRRSLDLARAVRGEEHEDVIQTKLRLGTFLAGTARSAEGLTLLDEALRLAVSTKGRGDLFHTQMVLNDYGYQLVLYGRIEEGLEYLSETIETRRRGKRSATRAFAWTLEHQAAGQIELGRYAQAKASLDETFDIYGRAGKTAPSGDLNSALRLRAGLLLATGRPNEAAEALAMVSLDQEEAARSSQRWLELSVARAELELANNQYQAAIRLGNDIRNRVKASNLRPYLKQVEAQASKAEGRGLVRIGRAAEALPLLERAIALTEQDYDVKRSPVLADAQVALAECLLNMKQRDRASGLIARARAIQSTHKELGLQYTTPLRSLEMRLRNNL
jgi:tetratricopeptide (TPR) repeat protein